MLKVQYERTFDDYVDFVFHRSRRLSSIRQSIYRRRLLIVVFFSAATGVTALVQPPAVAVFVGVGLAVLAPVFWVLIPRIVWKQVAAAVRSNVAELGVRTATVELTLTDEALVMVADAVRVEVPWDRVKGVEVVGDNTYIHLPSGLAAVVVRDGFEEERDYFAVQKFARRMAGEG